MILKYLKITLLVFIGLIVVLLLIPGPDKVESRVFCAYGKIFVEFEDGKSKWGTIMLDDDGRPLDCKRYLTKMESII